jgi:hypothetical protein
VAALFDVACLAKSAFLEHIPAFIYEEIQRDPSFIDELEKSHEKLGEHYFITNPQTGSGIVPRFDFIDSQKNPNAFVDAKKIGDLPSPSSKANVDWLELQGFLGDLAKTVFRVHTKAGQPAASVCHCIQVRHST